MNSVRAKVSESGRVSLPAEFRKAVGLDHGGDVVIELEGKAIRIRMLDDVIAEAQRRSRQILGDKPAGSVDAFLAERRSDSE
jgi:AbrB family looped-hinge helix DNA binding protein